MKNLVPQIIMTLFLLAGGIKVTGQSSFSPEEYLSFRKENKDMSAKDLLADYPPLNIYYSSREYPAHLSSVAWFDTLDRSFFFTEDEKALLRQNHFMVSERLSYIDWSSAMINLYSQDLPLFLSTDFILSSLHNSYDAVLQTIEVEFLEPNLKELLHAMYESVPEMAEKYASDLGLTDALEDMDLYISVALSLAEGKEFLPQTGEAGKFTEVMAAIGAEDLAVMTLFTETKQRKLDFSQFTPRGHYTEMYTWRGLVNLENYFRAMMWLGRIDFLMTAPPDNPWESGWTDDELRRMQLGALLLNELLYSSGKSENLEKHERLISFMVGPDDNLTPAELKALDEAQLSSLTDLFDQEIFDLFMEKLNSSDDYGQKIMSNFFYVDPDSTDPGKLPVSFKLLGQKFLIDSYVFSEVVYDRISYEGRKIHRPLPDPLDVMAAMGNENALALLEGELDTYKYASNMAGLQYLISSYDESFWKESLYNTWLGALRSLDPPALTTGYPYFMQTTAWHQEKLNTQLGSWAQLRHDNILYGKQSYTGGTGCSYPYTYVEPYPELYSILKDFASAAADFYELELPGNLPSLSRISNHFDRYAEIMTLLEDIAEKELGGEVLSEEEITFLKTMINSYMASGPSITGWYMDLFFDKTRALWLDFTVADVHTQPTEANGEVVGKVLHVGNGMINTGVFMAPNPCNPDQLMAFAGPVSSFHSEITRNFERLNDKDWEERFMRNGIVPERPDWVNSYLLDEDGKLRDLGRELKGEVYTGTGIISPGPSNTIDYLLLFPNPAGSQTGIRFVLNRSVDLRLEVFNSTGQLVYQKFVPDLPPSEHNIGLPAGQWQKGLYLVKVSAGDREEVRELVIL